MTGTVHPHNLLTNSGAKPGDRLVLRATLLRSKRGIWVFDCEATVDGNIAATAQIMCTEQDIER